MPIMPTRISLAVAALALSTLAASAQAPAGGMPTVQGPERAAMDRCVSQVLQRLQRARASYREVSPAIAQQCDSQLRAVLGAAIRQGLAGNCTVESCLDMARGRAGEQATMNYQSMTITR